MPYDKPHIVLIGNISDGYTAVGPFENFDDGADWADQDEEAVIKGSWIISLQPPKERD